MCQWEEVSSESSFSATLIPSRAQGPMLDTLDLEFYPFAFVTVFPDFLPDFLTTTSHLIVQYSACPFSAGILGSILSSLFFHSTAPTVTLIKPKPISSPPLPLPLPLVSTHLLVITSYSRDFLGPCRFQTSFLEAPDFFKGACEKSHSQSLDSLIARLPPRAASFYLLICILELHLRVRGRGGSSIRKVWKALVRKSGFCHLFVQRNKQYSWSFA